MAVSTAAAFLAALGEKRRTALRDRGASRVVEAARSMAAVSALTRLPIPEDLQRVLDSTVRLEAGDDVTP